MDNPIHCTLHRVVGENDEQKRKTSRVHAGGGRIKGCQPCLPSESSILLKECQTMATVSNQALKVAIVATGSVDAALGHRLTAAGRTIFTDLPNRSEETGRRALDASMQDRDLDYIVANSDLFMSVVPPRDSTILAETIQEKLRASLAHGRRDDKRRLVYVEANATSPDTVQHVSELFSGMEGVGFLSACIIGGPPEGDYDPTMSGRKEDLEILQKLGTLGLKIKVMQGKKAGIGRPVL